MTENSQSFKLIYVSPHLVGLAIYSIKLSLLICWVFLYNSITEQRNMEKVSILRNKSLVVRS